MSIFKNKVQLSLLSKPTDETSESDESCDFNDEGSEIECSEKNIIKKLKMNEKLN